MTFGQAAAKCGARIVLMTDINDAALRCARDNATKNGPRVQAREASADRPRPSTTFHRP